jgi:hypothetical protein
MTQSIWLLVTVTGNIVYGWHLFLLMLSHFRRPHGSFLRSAVLCLVIRKTVTHKVLVVVRTRSPIDWYYYTAHNLAVNPGDDYVFAEREVYRNRLSNLVRLDPRKFIGTDGFVDAMASQATASARALNLTTYFTAFTGATQVALQSLLYCRENRTGNARRRTGHDARHRVAT